MPKKTLGVVLRSARQKANRSMKSLADPLGVTVSYICDIEYDRRVPSDRVLDGLIRELCLDARSIQHLAGRPPLRDISDLCAAILLGYPGDPEIAGRVQAWAKDRLLAKEAA